MNPLVLIYIFSVFIIFTPGIFFSLGKKDSIKTIVLHGLLFALVICGSINYLFQNKLIEAHSYTLQFGEKGINLENILGKLISSSGNMVHKDKDKDKDNEKKSEKLKEDNFTCFMKLPNSSFDQPKKNNNTFGYYNGSSDVPNWKVDGVMIMNNSTAVGIEMPYPGEGDQTAALQNRAKMHTDVKLTPGDYTITFQANGRNCCDDTKIANTIDIYLNDEKISSITPEISKWKEYKTDVINIKHSGEYTLHFKGTNHEAFNGKGPDKTSAIKDIVINRL